MKALTGRGLDHCHIRRTASLESTRSRSVVTPPAQHGCSWRRVSLSGAAQPSKLVEVRGAAPSRVRYSETQLDVNTKAPSPRALSPASGLNQGQAAAQLQHLSHLQELTIQNFALVESAVVSLPPGLIAVTGESGAGKSVLMEALGQLLGAPAPLECVRPPAQSAIITGTFRLASHLAVRVVERLRELGVPPRALLMQQGDNITLVLRREILVVPANTSSGPPASRSKCAINGCATSLRVLKEVGALLVDTNGQHASLALRDAATQRALLDGIAGTAPLAAAFGARLSRLAAVEGQMRALQELGGEAERARLQRVCDVVARARVVAGEEVELRRSLQRMQERRAALEQCAMVRMALIGDGSGGSVADAVSGVEMRLLEVLATEDQIRETEDQAAEANSQTSSSGSSSRSSSSGSSSASSSSSSSGFGSSSNGTTAAAAAAPSGSRHQQQQQQEEQEEDEEKYDEDEDSSLDPDTNKGVAVMEEALEQLDIAKRALATAEAAVANYLMLFEFSESERAETESRLELLGKLMRTCRVRSTGALLELVDSYAERLEQYERLQGQQSIWEDEAAQLRKQLLTDALSLSQRRQAAAGQLRLSVERCLRDLAMGGSRFDVRISWEAVPQPQDASRSSSSSHVLHVPDEDALRLGQRLSSHAHASSSSSSSSSSNSNLDSVANHASKGASNCSSSSSSSNGANSSDSTSSSGRSSSEHVRSSAFRVHAGGLDSVEFLLAAGPTEPLRPLAGVASGGEGARIMLALKAAPVAAASASAAAAAAAGDGRGGNGSGVEAAAEGETADGLPSSSSSSSSSSSTSSSSSSSSTSSTSSAPQHAATRSAASAAAHGQHADEQTDDPATAFMASSAPVMVLDELDSGIGSRLGANVGALLRRMVTPPELAAAQVLCVTHLPQVAAHASHHIRVSKSLTPDGRAITRFEPLTTHTERCREVADMMGGGLEAAERMLAAAQGSPGVDNAEGNWTHG